jgi:hypothetical protein
MVSKGYRMKIYIVRGQTGEYSDQQEWIVCAYTDEQTAETHVVEAQAEATNIFKEGDRWNPRKNPFDPFMRVDYTGTKYWVEECELDPKDSRSVQ